MLKIVDKSSWVTAFWLAMVYGEFDIEQKIGFFATLGLLLFAWGLFLFTFALTFVRAFKNRDARGFKRYGLVLINIMAIVLVFRFSSYEFKLNRDFSSKLEKRLEMIRLIADDKLPRPYAYNRSIVHLPDNLASLSEGGGDVMLSGHSSDLAGEGLPDKDKLHVLFYVDRGFLSHYCGFVYAADDTPPYDASEAKILRQVQKNWYFIAM